MIGTMRPLRSALLAAICATTPWGLLQLSSAAQGSGPTAQAAASNPASSAAAARLDKKQYRDVKVSVDHGAATLTGTVNLYQDKADAEKRVHKAKGVTTVNNLIVVAGPTIPDAELGKTLATKLADKLSYASPGVSNGGSTISVRVVSGVVILAGQAHSEMDRDSALALVSTYPGVKDVVCKIVVDSGAALAPTGYIGVPSTPAAPR